MFLLCAFLALVGFALTKDNPHSETHWNPHHSELDLGTHASLHTAADDWIQILVDTEHGYMAVKDLHSYTCYLVKLAESHITADEYIAGVDKSHTAVLADEFHTVLPNLKHSDVQHLFGHRIAHYCQHNPTFMLARYMVPTLPVVF